MAMYIPHNFSDKPQGKRPLYSSRHTVEYNFKVDPGGNRSRKTGSLYCKMVGFYEKGNEPGGLKLTNFLTTAVIAKLCKYGVGSM
jgi:hypothetical protein